MTEPDEERTCRRLAGGGRGRSLVPSALLSLAIALAIAACSDRAPNDGSARPPGGPAPGAPWARTESREPCADYDPLRKPLFGDLHVHTRFSADAYIYGTRVGPRDAYDFARGGEIPLSDDDEQQTRRARIDRPLDFAAVTDHAEFFGEVDLCSNPASEVYDLVMCQELRAAEAPDDRFEVIVHWLFPAGIDNPPRSHAFCSMPGIDCDASAVSVWQEIQAAAEEAYDRTAACSFTSFVGYEHTASPLGRHLHRNVIFRNHHVPRFASSQLETAAEGSPQGVWNAVERDCLNAGEGCDAVIIPHNPNLSGGGQFVDPIDGADARRRQDREPLVEIHQVKSNSECRFDRVAGFGVGTEDELCTFEQRPNAHEGPDEPPPITEKYPRRNLVRNALKDGLAFEQSLGANPFKMGFVGSTDTHDGNPGAVAEAGWPGAQGNSDSSPRRQISGNVRDNPGGLAVVWAEENSRDAIFSALRRRETYATSGTRPVLRFFAGSLEGVSCDGADLVRRAYERGTPMGGDLGDVRDGASPRFAVLVAKDPGTAGAPGTDLQRVQIVKGWVEQDGTTRERVFDVAGDAANGATVDPGSCAPVGRGASQLCTVWEDPDFDRGQRAFYYVRVLENPTCRWSTLVCKAQGIDPFSADCAAQAAGVGPEFADCCLSQQGDPWTSLVVQERAWSSPVWYRPEAIARVDGEIELGTGANDGGIRLEIRVAAWPAATDLAASGLRVVVADDEELVAADVPPGGFAVGDSGAGGRRFEAPGAAVEIAADGSARIRVDARGLDLSGVDRVGHVIRVEVASGAYRAEHSRAWVLDGLRLVPAEG